MAFNQVQLKVVHALIALVGLAFILMASDMGLNNLKNVAETNWYAIGSAFCFGTLFLFVGVLQGKVSSRTTALALILLMTGGFGLLAIGTYL